MTKEIYDFIIVGGGPSGCSLSSLLSRTPSKPRILLLEAGGPNEERLHRLYGKRWSTVHEESMSWGYKTTPQDGLDGRVIDYARGKGLGGSSAVNFGVYAVGARDDYDEWAEKVGDEQFGWEEMKRRFKELEKFDLDFDSGPGDDTEKIQKRNYADPAAADHGDRGALKVGFAKEWEMDLPLVMDSLEDAGLKRNLDLNSGNPLGMGLCINSSADGIRSTAKDLLVDAPANLEIVTDTPVQRVLFDGRKAVGVQTKNKKFFASKEIILCAGSLEDPKILMHSGIGPASELKKFDIPIIQDIPAIGQGLRDHFFAPLLLSRKPETNDRNSFFKDQSAMDDAMKQWEQNGSGPWTKYGCQLTCGWFKSETITSSEEFKALPDEVQSFMNRETIPHYEVFAGFPIHLIFPGLLDDFSYTCLAVFLMNGQSVGEVRLQSSNPDEPLLFDPKYLEHPFDRRAAIEIYRHMQEVSRHPSFAKDTLGTILGPKSDGDEDILQFWKENLSSSWHMTGTVKMGKVGDEDAAVGNRFRVFGFENLRVADMSVVPVLTNNHTQTTAYVTGMTCADVLIKEYELDQVKGS